MFWYRRTVSIKRKMQVSGNRCHTVAAMERSRIRRGHTIVTGENWFQVVVSRCVEIIV